MKSQFYSRKFPEKDVREIEAWLKANLPPDPDNKYGIAVDTIISGWNVNTSTGEKIPLREIAIWFRDQEDMIMFRMVWG